MSALKEGAFVSSLAFSSFWFASNKFGLTATVKTLKAARKYLQGLQLEGPVFNVFEVAHLMAAFVVSSLNFLKQWRHKLAAN